MDLPSYPASFQQHLPSSMRVFAPCLRPVPDWIQLTEDHIRPYSKAISALCVNSQPLLIQRVVLWFTMPWRTLMVWNREWRPPAVGSRAEAELGATKATSCLSMLPADRRDGRECRELNSLDKLKNVPRRAQEKQLHLERDVKDGGKLIARLVFLAQVQREMTDNQVAAHNTGYNRKLVTRNIWKFMNNKCRLSPQSACRFHTALE